MISADLGIAAADGWRDIFTACETAQRSTRARMRRRIMMRQERAMLMEDISQG